MKRIIQFNIEDPRCLYIDKVDPEEIVEFVKAVNANTLVVFARDGWGNAFYKSKIYPIHKVVEENFLNRLKELCDKNGIELVLMVCHTSNKFLAEKYPECVQKNWKGKIICLDSKKYRNVQWPLMCLNSKFLEFCEEEIKEVYNLTNYFMLDSFRYQPDPDLACYCDNCKKKFNEEFGEELKPCSDFNSEYFWKVWNWRYNIVIRSLERLKNVVGDKKLVYNSHPAGWNWRNNTIVERGREVLDIIFAECSETDFQPLGFLIEMTKLTRGLSNREVWVSRNAFHIFSTPYLVSKEALELGIWEIVAAGGCPLITTFLSTYIQNKDKISKLIGEVFRKVEIVENEMVDARPVEDILIVYSNSSRDYYAKDNPNKYNLEVRGFFYALLNTHYQVGFIGEENFDKDKIDDAKAIILPNFVTMDKKHLNVLKKSDKKIIATYLTSMYDKYNLRDNFLISEEIGADFVRIERIRWFYLNNILFGDYNGDIGNVIRIQPRDFKYVKYNIHSGIYKYGYEYTLGISPPPEGKIISYVTQNKFVYFPFQFGKALFKYGYKEYYMLLKQVLDIRPVVELEKYETLRTIVWKGKDRYLVFLINETTSRRTLISYPAHAKFLKEATVAANVIREVIPLFNIELKVWDKDVKQARLLFKNIDLKLEDAGSYLKLKIPSIDIFDLLILEK